MGVAWQHAVLWRHGALRFGEHISKQQPSMRYFLFQTIHCDRISLVQLSNLSEPPEPTETHWKFDNFFFWLYRLERYGFVDLRHICLY